MQWSHKYLFNAHWYVCKYYKFEGGKKEVVKNMLGETTGRKKIQFSPFRSACFKSQKTLNFFLKMNLQFHKTVTEYKEVGSFFKQIAYALYSVGQ